MKTLIAMLIICSLIQYTILPIDLVLIILICRSYLKSDKNNLLLAFSFGLLNGLLNISTLGLTSLIYLFLVAITESLSRSRLAGNLLLIVPLSLVFLTINQLVISVYLHQYLELFPKILIESLLSLPVLYFVRLWEERFIVRKDIKLRV